MKISVPVAFVVATLASLFGCPSTAADAPRPNILYFYVDDMGWGSIGPNGQDERRAEGLPAVKTPNLDALARAGVNFTRGYGCFVCSPARSSQQTGFHQGHTFADRNDPDNAKKAIRRDDITMGDALSAAGYVTGYWGKWGYGGSKDQQNPTIDNVQTLPTSHGYKHVLAELHHVRAHTFFQPTLWHAPAKPGAKGGIELAPNRMTKFQNNAAYPNQPAMQNHPKYPATAYCDDSYAFAALDFVRTQGQNYNQTGQPFFGLLAVQIPHAPFGEIATLPEWDLAYQDDPHFKSLPKQSQQWAAMVTRIDAHFGNILAALEDPNHDGDKNDSITENTLVVFQSDNGGPGGSNNESFDANGGLTGTKGKIQEGGIRVPLVMRWPGKVDAGQTIDHPVDVTDLLPTFCELAGSQTPLGIDGVSIAHKLCGYGKKRERDFLIHEAGNGNSIIFGDHKLVQSLKRSKKKIIAGKLSLFDLSNDPQEATDLSKSKPRLVEKYKRILVAERVDEPKGFANTYHSWIGTDNADAGSAENWSDYKYANAGITYTTDNGPPQLSWVARMHNESSTSKTAIVGNELKMLALEVRGKSTEAQQTLSLKTKVADLTARNELRLGPFGKLSIAGGSVNTMRWVTVSNDATLTGFGSIKGDIESNGTLNADQGTLRVDGDFVAGPQSKIVFSGSAIEFTGTVTLAGTIKPSRSGKVIGANKIIGRFDVPAGAPFTVQYTNKQVTVQVNRE